MRHTVSSACVLALSVAAIAPGASGALVIGNYTAPQGTGTAFGGTATTIFKAAGFTMGAQSHFLTSVTLNMDFTGAGTPRIAIWSGAGAPAAELTVLNNPGALGGNGDYTFTPTGSFTLNAGQQYWLYVQATPISGGGSFLWQGTLPSTAPSGPGATHVGYNFNGNSSTFFNRYMIEGTPVPAPGAAALFGLAGLVGARRRR